MSPKKRTDNRLPPYVYKGRSAYEFKPYRGPGVARPTIRLCSIKAPLSTVWQCWEDQQAGAEPDTLEWLLREYTDSREFTHKGKNPKAESTIKEQRRMLDKIIERPRGQGKTFGSARLNNITPGVIRRYLDARLNEDAGVAGNRERALISKAWSWAYARDKTRIKNPCLGVERNPEQPRQHYADDTNYNAWLQYLVESDAPWYLAVVQELCYLCRMRKIEALTAKKTQILDNGFDTLRRKGSRDGITEWSPRLRAAAIDVPRAYQPARFSEYIVTNTRGQRLTVSAYNSSRGRWMKKAIDLGIVGEKFTTHDLKRKGATDSDQPATVTTGNSEQMTKIYDVKKLIAKATR